MEQKNNVLPYVPLGMNDLSVIEQMLIHYEQYLVSVLPDSENREAWLRISQTLRRRIGYQLLALRKRQQVALTLTDYEVSAIDAALLVCLTTLKICLPQCEEVKEAIKACEGMKRALAPLKRLAMTN